MSGTLFKVWTLTDKKMVFASNMEQLLATGRKKLSLGEATIRVYLQDGTEVDDDDILKALEAQTILYFLRDTDMKPWEQVSQIFSVENYQNTSSDSAFEALSVTPSCEDENVPFDITKQLLQPWPKTFSIPVSLFSEELSKAVETGNLVWRTKSELLGHLSREISKYSLKPSAAQRDQVARELVNLFPALKSNIGEGHYGWAQKIYDKMCEEMKRRLVTNGPQSLKKDTRIGAAKSVKRPRRGEINFLPLETPSDEVKVKSKNLLADEILKPLEERSSELLSEHMRITFSDRRMLVSQKCLTTELNKEYPVIFTEHGVLIDFNLINNFDLESRFLERLCLCAEKIKEEAILAKKGNKQGIFDEVLNQHADSMTTALLLLPHLLGDKDPQCLHIMYRFETDISIVKTSGPETPHVAVLGDITTNLCYIVVENNIVIPVNGFVRAVMLMFGVYYCCNMEFAPKVIRTLKFIQTYILKMYEANRLPSKLITFSSKMP